MKPDSTFQSFWKAPKTRAVLIAALAFGFVALAFVLFLDRVFVEGSGLVFIAPLFAMLVGGAAWWLMLRYDMQVSVWRSALTGALVGLLVHPFILYFALVFRDLSKTPLSLLGKLNALEILIILPVLTLISWLFLGWLTVPLGALTGAGITYFELDTLKLPSAAKVSEEYAKYFNIAKRVLAAIGVLLLALVGVLILMACLPVSTNGLESQPNPAPDYATALARLEKIQAQEAQEPWLEVCHSRLMTHGQQTERAIVLLHGYTNCPRQYWELGQQFYDRGYNVLMLRMPVHVNKNFDVAELNALTAEALRAYGDTAVDLTRGFGKEVYVLGLSGGGTVAGWIAQYRPEAARVMLLAPFFATTYVPGFLNLSMMRLAMHLPGIPMRGKQTLDHAYPGNATRGVGEFLRYGEAVRQAAMNKKPVARSIILVTNANDDTVDNDYARAVIDLWRKQGATIETFEFDKKYKLLHDMIDVGQRYQPIEWTYPALIDLMEGRQPTLP